MKKLLALLLVLSVVFTLCACGGSDEAASESSEPSTPIETEKIEREKVSDVDKGSVFSDGVAVASFFDSEAAKTRYVVIDTEGYIIGEFDEPVSLEECQYYNDCLIYNNKMFDKSGKVIASPEISGYTELLAMRFVGQGNEKTLAQKQEYTSEGTVFYYGLLDNKGNWIKPLSATYDPEVDGFKISGAYFPQSDSIIQKEEGGRQNIYRQSIDGEETKIAEDILLDTTLSGMFIGDDLKDEKVNYAIYDSSGKLLVDLGLDFVPTVRVEYGCIVVYDPDYMEWHHTATVYNLKGELLFGPLQDSDVYGVWEKYGIYKGYENKYYYFDGREVSLGEYGSGEFSDGLFLVTDANGSACYIDLNGKVVIK